MIPSQHPAVSIIGLGKLGAPMAASIAARGLRVVGHDVDPAKVAAVREGRALNFEPGLVEMFARGRERVGATESLAEAVSSTDATFVIVPTPSEASGRFSLQYANAACEAIGKALARKASWHLVAISCTVMPGDTGGPLRETLERASGKRCGTDFGLCYSPEFIALGSVCRDFLNPDMVLVGQHDVRSGDAIEAIYRVVLENGAPVYRTSLVNAELAKISVNAYITTKITFANMLARLCEAVPGADVDQVTGALGLDTRIGKKYLRGAVGFGGPCFPRDNVALSTFAREVGATTTLSDATQRSNLEQVRLLAQRVRSLVPRGGTVGILGLSYKPATDVIEESQGVMLAADLGVDVPVVCYDPAAMGNAGPVLGGKARMAASLEECVRSSDVIVLMTPWDEFRSLQASTLRREGAPRIVVDCWRCLDRERVRGAAEYVALGVGPAAG